MRYHGGGFREVNLKKDSSISRFFLIEASGHVLIEVIESRYCRVVITESVLEVWDR